MISAEKLISKFEKVRKKLEKKAAKESKRFNKGKARFLKECKKAIIKAIKNAARLGQKAAKVYIDSDTFYRYYLTQDQAIIDDLKIFFEPLGYFITVGGRDILFDITINIRW